MENVAFYCVLETAVLGGRKPAGGLPRDGTACDARRRTLGWGIGLCRHYSGRCNVRASPNVHAAAVGAAAAGNISLNEWASKALDRATQAGREYPCEIVTLTKWGYFWGYFGIGEKFICFITMN